MTERLQSPEIASALRDALSLDGAGSISMEMDQIVSPVAIVADVRDLLRNNQVPVAHYGTIGPVAAQRSYASIEFQQFQNPNPRAILVDEIRIWSATSQLVYVGLNNAPMAGAAVQAGRRQFSDQTQGMAGRILMANSANASLVLAPFASSRFWVPSNTEMTVIRPPSPWTLVQPGHNLAVVCDTQNTDLVVCAFWREDYRD